MTSNVLYIIVKVGGLEMTFPFDDYRFTYSVMVGVACLLVANELGASFFGQLLAYMAGALSTSWIYDQVKARRSRQDDKGGSL